MILALIGAFQLAVATPPIKQIVYNGRLGETAVHVPFLDATATIDGDLDEPGWSQAALLTGFSEYMPVDQRPSPDSTEVLIWYSSNAMFFGIRAYEPHGPVHSALADRDLISSDDNVEIHLDTYDQRTRAFVFIVNPLGVQADGVKNELGGFIPGSNIMPGQNDLSADFLWESKGHVTTWGYQVEIRIPFSSLRYPPGSPQNWGIQIQRNVQHNGYTETWTPARKASASFIAQEGQLLGLSGMHHGQVADLNPELTNTANGAPAADAWHYDNRLRLGGNVRWAMGSNFVLNGTVKPDFSQIEADATQIAADERFALFYPEKRPFFVEGSDQFNVPNTLIYTRTIVQPDAAVKLTGRVGRTDIAAISALDASSTTAAGQRPLVDIIRLNRSFGSQSTVGMLYSERVGGGRANRLVDGDVHWQFDPRTYAQLQAVMSTTTQNGSTVTAPMFEGVVDGTGRAFGFHYNVIGFGNGFAADNGYVQRTGIVTANTFNRLTLYGAPGALLERFNVYFTGAGTWRYNDFFAAKSVLEDKLSPNASFTFRGGWSLGVTPTLSTYAFDPAAYATDFIAVGPAIRPFVPSPRTTTFVTRWTASTPQFATWDATVGFGSGNDVDFVETSRVQRLDYNAGLDLRPTQQIRVSATYQTSTFTRRSDNVRTAVTRIPRLKAEYQLTRSIFFRIVGQYTTTLREPLVDPTTGAPILTGADADSAVATTLNASNSLRVDWLFSYRPSPGTVFFFGYGNTLAEPDALRFNQLTRTNDAFFVKVSYVFRALGSR